MQSILICISARIIVRHVKALIQQEARLSNGINHLNVTKFAGKSMSQDSQKNCLRQQTFSLAVSYLLFATTDIVMMAIGNSVIGQNKDFECDKSDEVVRKLSFFAYLYSAKQRRSRLSLLLQYHPSQLLLHDLVRSLQDP